MDSQGTSAPLSLDKAVAEAGKVACGLAASGVAGVGARGQGSWRRRNVAAGDAPGRARLLSDGRRGGGPGPCVLSRRSQRVSEKAS
jgi:hypothetical protein